MELRNTYSIDWVLPEEDADPVIGSLWHVDMNRSGRLVLLYHFSEVDGTYCLIHGAVKPKLDRRSIARGRHLEVAGPQFFLQLRQDRIGIHGRLGHQHKLNVSGCSWRA